MGKGSLREGTGCPKGRLREYAGGCTVVLHREKNLSGVPATATHAAPCVKALWYVPQAPSDPAYAGPPPSQREALGLGENGKPWRKAEFDMLPL